MSATQLKTPQLKVLIVGDSGVGKTTYLKRYQTGEFEKIYNPTDISSVYPIEIKDSNIIFNCWDIPSKYNTKNFNNADAAIVMFDIQSHVTYKSVEKWINNIKKKCGDIPIVILANKVDVINKNNTKKTFTSRYPLLYSSSRSNYNYEAPFNYIIDALKNSNRVQVN
jgi:GTP-binding nuclear protein Ran